MTAEVRPIEPLHRLPPSPAQERFWFLESANPGSAVNHVAARWEMHGHIHPAEIEAAFAAIVARHEILRTRFAAPGGRLEQQVMPAAPFQLGQVDLRGLPADRRQARVEAIAAELVTEPFELHRPPLMRAAVLRTGLQRATLVLAAHHLVFDGGSAPLLAEELARLLAGEGAAGLPELALQYGDYALWREACRAADAQGPDAAYWQEALDGAARFSLASGDSPATRAGAPAGHRHALDPGLGDRLRDAAATAGVSAYALAAAAFAAALHGVTGARDLCFGAAVSERGETHLEPLIGAFVNTVPLRLRPDPAAPVAALVAEAGQAAAGAVAHGGLPLEDMLRRFGPPRRPGDGPFPGTMFALQDLTGAAVARGPLRLEPRPVPAPGIGHDLDATLVGDGDGWHLAILHDPARVDASRVARLAELFATSLEAAITAPSTPLAALTGGVPAVPVDDEPTAVRSPDPAPPRLHVVAPADPPIRTAAAGDGPLQPILRLWSELLDLPAGTVTPGRDFFELGGDSILALRMLARLEAQTGRRPDLGAFLADPTPAGLAALIGAGAATPGTAAAVTRYWEVIELARGASGGPIVVSLNQPFLYRTMAGCFAPGVRVLNLHLRPDVALEAGGPQVRAQLVAQAAALVAQETAGRPAALVGHCVDGLMAQAVAQRLAATPARQAPLLAMIDSWPPDATGAAPGRFAEWRARQAGRARRWWCNLRLALTGRIGWGAFLGRSAAVQRLAVRLGRRPAPTQAERRERAVNAWLRQLFADARPEPFDGEAVIFATAHQSARDLAAGLGWDGLLAADTALHRLQGWHEEALASDGARRIAAVLGARLARGGERHGPGAGLIAAAEGGVAAF